MVVLAGGCQCGEVRYVISTFPLTLYVCHCLDCQKQSASGFGMSMPIPRNGFLIGQGIPEFWRRTAASGRIVSCAFCKTCGTRLYHAPDRNPAIVNVKPGTLDDPLGLIPVGHVWVSRALSWLKPAITGLVIDGQPDDFEAFFAAWAELYGQNPNREGKENKAAFKKAQPNLAEAIRRRFDPFGGVDDLHPNPPVPVGEPPQFD